MNKNGFTLVELIVVVVIIAILLSLATINFTAWTRKNSMEAQVKQIYSDLLGAKVDSMHKRERHTMTIAVNANNYNVVDNFDNVVVLQRNLPYPVTTSAGAGVNLSIAFETNGQNLGAVNGMQAICLQNNDNSVAYDSVIIDQTKINLAKRNAGGACNSAIANYVIK